MRRISFSLTLILLFFYSFDSLGQLKPEISLSDKAIVFLSGGKEYKFAANFTVLYTEKDPDMAYRRLGTGVEYSVLTWKADASKQSDLRQTTVKESMAGDGFDDRILKGDQKGRTVNMPNAASEVLELKALNAEMKGKDTVVFSFPKNHLFELEAFLVVSKDNYPAFQYILKPLVDGYFSIGYTGSPSFKLEDVNRIWQPMIWHDKKFPDNAYITPSHLTPIPATFAHHGNSTLGVLAAPKYLPFNPLPLLDNSQFGVTVRSIDGLVQSQVFAPILGGFNSKMTKGTEFNFEVFLVAESLEVTYAYEKIARQYFGFKDFRKNDIASLNQTLENIVNYSISDKTWFIDSLKGYAYSTDVPGAVKNVSSLNPVELSLVMDHKEMLEKRTYPLLEYVLSRENLLFSLDSTQKIQNPSRKLYGPVARVSELLTLYNIWKNPIYLHLAEEKAGVKREREKIIKPGASWVNAMYLYKATGDKIYLDKALAGADNYLRTIESNKKQAIPIRGFFWTSFTNNWMILLELYELTGDKKYLDAAHEGARQFTMLTWMSPKVPDSLMTVNIDGKAPMYWYLQRKGHKQVYYPEEQVEAWRLSEIGLTSESSGTSAGHRAIFMANYAPWMLRIGYHADDAFLKEVAKAAIIGRYRNFPGYHVNTARTTAYEKFDFPFIPFEEQSVTSFHYNHILPMASMLLDYLVSDAYVRSAGQIDFPSEYIEGYAYLQNKLYGKKKGRFFDEENIQLWMPEKLFQAESVELNYISGRKDNSVFVAFMNQSAEAVSSVITLNADLLKKAGRPSTFSIYRNGQWDAPITLSGNSFKIDVEANGLTVLKLQDIIPVVNIQEMLITDVKPIENDFVSIETGRTKAMLLRFGSYASKAYVYLQDDDNVFSEVNIYYTLPGRKKQMVITDKEYPFEFTIDVDNNNPSVWIELEGIKKDGTREKSKKFFLGEKTIKN